MEQHLIPYHDVVEKRIGGKQPSAASLSGNTIATMEHRRKVEPTPESLFQKPAAHALLVETLSNYGHSGQSSAFRFDCGTEVGRFPNRAGYSGISETGWWVVGRAEGWRPGRAEVSRAESPAVRPTVLSTFPSPFPPPPTERLPLPGFNYRGGRPEPPAIRLS